MNKRFDSSGLEGPSTSTGFRRIIKTKCSRTIPCIKTRDIRRMLPKFTAVSSRNAENGINLDEIDILQLELEKLLCIAVQRTLMLQNEMQNIDRIESNKGKVFSDDLYIPIKRKRQEESHTKSKDNTELCTNQTKIPRFKNTSPAITPVPSQSSSFNSSIKMVDNNVKISFPSVSNQPKNNVSSKFWLSFEPYCAPISDYNVKCIKSLLASNNNTIFPPIPPLGKHYSEVWADEHISEEQARSNPDRYKNSSDVASLREKGEKYVNQMIDSATSQLASTSLENGDIRSETSNIEMELDSQEVPVFRKSITLEKRLQNILIDEGMLNPENILSTPDDEIMTNIKQSMAELTSIKKTKAQSLQKLLVICKQEVARNDLKKKLEQVDNELIEMYKRFIIAEQKQQPLTQKEKNDAMRLINEQIRLNNEIDAMPLTTPD